MTKIPNPFFVLELANNHMGDTNHGIHVIQEFSKICRKFPYQFAFKLQYRNLESFVHPSMKGRIDLNISSALRKHVYLVLTLIFW